MESPSSSRKRISSLWKLLFNTHKFKRAHDKISSDTENNSNVDEQQQSTHELSGGLVQSSSENKWESSDGEHNCLPTILKKSKTNPSHLPSPFNTSRHATFMEVVKVHEYITKDTLANEEHYTSEASLTDDDESHPNKTYFYLEQECPKTHWKDGSSSESEQVVPSNNIKNNEDGDTVYDEKIASKEVPVKSNKQGKSKKAIKTKKNKKIKFSDDLVDDAFFDFSC